MNMRTGGQALLGLALAATLGQGPAAGAAATATATFAGGCFWSVEKAFDRVPGVVATVSGFAGGQAANPSYEQVLAGGTGHREAVQVTFDPVQVDYATLVEIYWRNIDPLDPSGQICHYGEQYRTAIFTHDPAQWQAATASKAALDASGRFDRPVATEILPATTFYPAEDYHQDFHLKNPERYERYRLGCGRDRRLQQLWGDEAGAATL